MHTVCELKVISIVSALQDLEPGQLLLFVQSFGIPVQSMSKLLQCLDAAVDDDPEGMENSVVDKVSRTLITKC